MDQRYPPTYTPPGYTPPPGPPKKPAHGRAIASLVCGIIAMTLPVPILDIIAGVVGLVLAASAKKEGSGGMGTAGLVCSIIGTIWSIQFTLEYFGIIEPVWQAFF